MDIFAFSAEWLLFLFCTALLAGLVDTLAGGGGLITLPALIMSGLPPLAAIGTNKLQGSMGTATASMLMFKKRKVSWKQIKYAMLAAFSGSLVGAVAIHFVDAQTLSFIIPVVLTGIALYFLFMPTPGQYKTRARLSAARYHRLVLPVIGAYDGMFGPGTGSFLSLAGCTLRSQQLVTATAVAKPLNFATNVAALSVFLLSDQIVWSAGILMMLGQILGAWLGAHVLFRIQPRYLRLIIVSMSLGMLAKYLLDRVGG